MAAQTIAPDERRCDACGAVVNVLDAHWAHEDDCTHRHPPMQHGCIGCTCDRTLCPDCCTDCAGQLTLEGTG